MTKLHEMKLQEYIKEAEIKHRMEMSEVEERKSIQIKNLIDAHEKSFMEMKNYYNDITLSNLGLISSLKEQMEDLRKQSQKNEKIAFEVNINMCDKFLYYIIYIFIIIILIKNHSSSNLCTIMYCIIFCLSLHINII